LNATVKGVARTWLASGKRLEFGVARSPVT
jgi:hypothetical protein